MVNENIKYSGSSAVCIPSLEVGDSGKTTMAAPRAIRPSSGPPNSPKTSWSQFLRCHGNDPQKGRQLAYEPRAIRRRVLFIPATMLPGGGSSHYGFEGQTFRGEAPSPHLVAMRSSPMSVRPRNLFSEGLKEAKHLEPSHTFTVIPWASPVIDVIIHYISSSVTARGHSV